MISDLADGIIKAQSLLSLPQSINRIVISGKQRNKSPQFLRIDIRPVLIKSAIHWQVVSHDGKKDITKNLRPEALKLEEFIQSGFANLLIENDQVEFTLRVTKSGQAQLNTRRLSPADISRSDKQDNQLSHDRVKSRLLDENEELFKHLGITDHDGKLKPSRSDKFKQVQEFLKSIQLAIEFVQVDTKDQSDKNAFKIVDLGCGHAYLTFAAHRFARKLGLSPEVLGVDERVDSRDRNNAIADLLNISSEMKFSATKIAELPAMKTDLAIALHACDTATDDSIAWAVKSKSSVILVAPCCHHDIQKQLSTSPAPWKIATRYGILQERVGDIITDSIRAQILRVLGYRTEIIEFIAGDHTPRNLMIRAFKSHDGKSAANSLSPQQASEKAADFQELDQMIEQWQIKPKLMDLLRSELEQARAGKGLS